MLLGLRTVVYKVADLAAAKAWYARVFDIAPYFDEPFYVGFNVGGYELGLDPDTSDLAAVLERAAGRGAAVAEPLQDVGGGIKVAALRDPFGNLVGLIENPSFALPG